MESEIKGIVKYIEVVYHPYKITIESYGIYDDIEEKVISVYMDEISDDYITNPNHKNPKYLKEKNLELKIRKDIYNYFGTMTSGLTLDGFSPYTYHGLTIDVHLN